MQEKCRRAEEGVRTEQGRPSTSIKANEAKAKAVTKHFYELKSSAETGTEGVRN